MAWAVETMRHSAALGPVKIEFILLSAPQSDDQVLSLLQRPVGVLAGFSTLSAQAGTASAGIVEGKLIQIGITDGTSDILLIVVGF
jgi:hypothetical protein